MKRTFIAVKIEAGNALVKMISTLRTELKQDSIKWADLNQMHLTLAFLGDTGEETIKQVSSMLQKICSGFGEVNFRISGLGVFRNTGDPRVIWAGIESTDKFEDLYNKIKEGLRGIGVTIEERQFRPHLTLGRVKWLKNKSLLEKLAEQYNKKVFQDVNITEIVFYESILRQPGPLYVPITVSKLT
jgi:RNA 2',3'-cyclic 3'-phosphodiesterase